MKTILIINGSWKKSLELREYIVTVLAKNFLSFPSVLIEPQDLQKDAPLRILIEYPRKKEKLIKDLIQNAVNQLNKKNSGAIAVEFKAV